MKIVVLGASGMLGQALVPEGLARGHQVVSDRVEVTDDAALIAHLKRHQPDVIINAAALCDLNTCEADPERAYRVNTLPVLTIAENSDAHLVQISSDQAANPINVYAKSKRAAEEMAGPDSLIIRTNIVGPRNMGWAFKAIENDLPVTLFTDYFTSSIDVWSFSRALFDVLERGPNLRTGLLNIASRSTVSKKMFIEALALKLGKPLTRARDGSVMDTMPERPLMNKLDVWEVEVLLKRRMPRLCDVVNALVERRNQPCINPLPLTGVS